MPGRLLIFVPSLASVSSGGEGLVELMFLIPARSRHLPPPLSLKRLRKSTWEKLPEGRRLPSEELSASRRERQSTP